MRKKSCRHFIGDFETTVFEGQDYTEVWASAVVEIGTEDVVILHSIGETLDYLVSLKSNIIIYYHNLKFDGNFWLAYLLESGWKQAYKIGKDELDIEWMPEKDMANRTFKYVISDRGQWYDIILKINNKIIEIRDSLKILPLSVKKIGKSFGTKHQKLDMEYTGFRYAGCTITDEEAEYIKNDVLVVAEAMKMMYDLGHDKMTIGSNCLAEYKTVCKLSLKNQLTYEEMFPDMYNISLDKTVHGVDNAGDWIRKSYRGGWCYLAKGKSGKIYHNGCTADVNSLYPSMMHSESGNRYPVGIPHFWRGNIIPDSAKGYNRYYFIRFKTRFYLKEGYLPFVQIKGSLLYEGTESLESSDYYDRATGKYYSKYVDIETGKEYDTRVTMTMTMVDYQLFREHYNVVEFEILDGCWFYTQIGIFDEYIDKYKKIKQESTGGIRQIAKLFLNNLYGKMATNQDSSFKVARLEDGVLKFVTIVANDKQAGYIPVGSAITSYSRNFTIRSAQKNYHGVNARGFIYADTDSIHCDLSPEEVQGIKIHPSDFCCWKIESEWDEAIFTRQKTYIEHIVKEDGEEIENPYSNIKCAGMPDRCKNLFQLSMDGNADPDAEWSDDEREFLFEDDKPIIRTYEDFKVGLKVPDKLTPKRIRGGIVLRNTTYEMR